MDLRVINKRIIFQRMRKRSKTLLSFFIQQQNWTGIQDANLTSVEFLIHRELPHYQLLCWVKWSSHLIRTCKLSYIPDWLYKVMICRVLISSACLSVMFLAQTFCVMGVTATIKCTCIVLASSTTIPMQLFVVDIGHENQVN